MYLRLLSAAVIAYTGLVQGASIPHPPQLSAAKVSTLYQFPSAPNWLENINQRSNGLILATQMDPANLYQFDPSQPVPQIPQIVANVPGVNALLGIVEYAADVFAVVAGNVTLANVATNPSQSGSFSIVSVDLNESPATITTLAHFPKSGFLNGLTFVPPSATAPEGILLVVDSQPGSVWSLNIATRETAVASTDLLMVSCAGTPQLGINGIHYDAASSRAYFTNSWCGFLASIAIDPSTGKSVDNATRIGPPSQSIAFVDDFALDLADNMAFFAHATYDQIGAENLKSGAVSVVAGKVNMTEIAEPTSVWIGRTADDKARGRLYVTTAGVVAAPINDTITVGGQLLAIDTKVWQDWA